MNYVQLSISPVSQEQSEILIAALSDMGFDGFEEEENILHAFIPENIFDPENIATTLSPKFSFSKKIIAEQNWNEEWEKNFQPISVGDFCSVRAEFHLATSKTKFDIIITPKMSFGTGHHATTYMMIDTMKNIDFKEKTVLDFGTGTGVLAILAEKCGAKSVLAIDNDEWSIRNATENILMNRCGRITVEKRDSTRDAGVFDIILANINKNVIIENLPDLQQHLSAEGVLLTSGFLQQDLFDLEKEAEKNSLTIVAPPQMLHNWLSLRLKKI
ncbi:MAG: 50S ribosomal protein L11 methyltransferase [Bacteroidetes bacterium]|nr:50S ribosomal protein L11 methyltransferase [Bacteroidota bacterium]